MKEAITKILIAIGIFCGSVFLLKILYPYVIPVLFIGAPEKISFGGVCALYVFCHILFNKKSKDPSCY